jgi:hypothetical protein
LERQIVNERNHRQSLEDQLTTIKSLTIDDGGTLREERDQLARNLEQERQRTKQLEDELRNIEAPTASASPSDGQDAVSRGTDEFSERLRQALAENDRLRSVIRGLGINV